MKLVICTKFQVNRMNCVENRRGGGVRLTPHISELAWKSVVRGDLYESPYLAKATPFMESQKGQYSRLLISSKLIGFSQLYYLNSQLASLFP